MATGLFVTVWTAKRHTWDKDLGTFHSYIIAAAGISHFACHRSITIIASEPSISDLDAPTPPTLSHSCGVEVGTEICVYAKFFVMAAGTELGAAF